MKASELRDMAPEALEEKKMELGKEAFNLRFQHAAAQLDNVARIRQVRRDIARIQTVLGEQQKS